MAAIGAALVVAVLALWALHGDPTLLLAVGLLFLVPGRVGGYLWRDLYRGRRLLDGGDTIGGVEATRRFLLILERRPRLRGLWWLAWGVYTRDPRAMALNNLGFAHLRLGRLDEAEAALLEAIAADPEYALPHSSLAVISELRGESTAAAAHARRAMDLGYSRDALDRLLEGAGAALARVEGRGPGFPNSPVDV